MWTADALRSEARPYRAEVWRVVEDQSRAATVKLTDTLDEQALLEDLLEETKPPLPASVANLDFLLATPFRYWPYPHGSRFRRAGQPEGAFYASEEIATAIAETAFYFILFYIESPEARPPANPLERSAICVPVWTSAALDLTAAPLAEDSARWTHPIDYARCQDLADAARAAGVEVLRYASARDPQGRPNVALLSPRAFAALAPTDRQTWHLFVTRDGVRAWCEHPRDQLEFPRATFAADPRLRALPPN